MEKGIELVFEVEGAGVEVLGDRLRTGEILDNLIGNALKFTHSGGRVRVYTERVGQELVTHVADTGQGLGPEELESVFAGRRLSARPTAGEPSTGLGLVIVRKLVELQGGRVWATSEKGRGSTFSFSLPLGPAQE
jgi:signal transduction histidine kinase